MSEAAISLDPKQIEVMSLVDLAYVILRQTNKPFHYRDLMMQVAGIKGLTEEQVNEVIARLYTEINIDGRFLCIGSNVWGLKRWYPTDKTAPEKAAGGKKFVRKDIDEDDDFYDEEDDDAYEEEEVDDEPFTDYDATEEDEETLDGFTEEAIDDEEVVEEAAEEEEDLDSYEDEDEDF
ncbi:MAG: DNA-directed RNA polymerase subunit delta [Tumebacillaceae bacterium]